MCSDEQHKELLAALAPLKKRDPIDFDIQLSDNRPWRVDYKERLHLFMWLPTALTLVMDDYGSGPVQAQVWINVGLRPGTLIKTSGTSSLTLIRFRATDEVVP